MRIFGREPALWLGLVSAVVQLVSALWLPLTVEQQGGVNAVAVAVLGVVTAVAVAKERVAPAVLGLVQAVLALALAFGLHLPDTHQSVIMAFAAAVAAMFTRTQVVAPAPPDA